MKKHLKGFELYKNSKGKLSNVDIARELDVSNDTVRKWKSRYKWDEELGIKKNVTKSIKTSVTKSNREIQQTKIINALTIAGIYSPALDLLIDVYLDAYEEYQAEKSEILRRELARLLGQLGLDAKNKTFIKPSEPKKEEKKEEKAKEPENKLLMFRKRTQND